MKAAVIGSGRIGCGYAGHLLSAAGYEVVFLSRNPSMDSHLNRLGCYRVPRDNGRDRTEYSVSGARAVNMAYRETCVAMPAQADPNEYVGGNRPPQGGQMPQVHQITSEFNVPIN